MHFSQAPGHAKIGTRLKYGKNVYTIVFMTTTKEMPHKG